LLPYRFREEGKAGHFILMFMPGNPLVHYSLTPDHTYFDGKVIPKIHFFLQGSMYINPDKVQWAHGDKMKQRALGHGETSRADRCVLCPPGNLTCPLISLLEGWGPSHVPWTCFSLDRLTLCYATLHCLFKSLFFMFSIVKKQPAICES
jgi:hypothetical protein